MRHSPHCLNKCVFVCNRHPLPLPCVSELLLGISCAIASWRFISSETFPFAWFSLSLQRKRNTFPTQIRLDAESRIQYSMCSLIQHTPIGSNFKTLCVHTYTHSQYQSEGLLFQTDVYRVHKGNVCFFYLSLDRFRSTGSTREAAFFYFQCMFKHLPSKRVSAAF